MANLVKSVFLAKRGLLTDTGRKPVRRKPKATAKAGKRNSAVRATEFDRSKIDGRTKVGKAALAALDKKGRKSKADIEALAAVGYPGAAAKLKAARKPSSKRARKPK